MAASSGGCAAGFSCVEGYHICRYGFIIIGQYWKEDEADGGVMLRATATSCATLCHVLAAGVVTADGNTLHLTVW